MATESKKHRITFSYSNYTRVPRQLRLGQDYYADFRMLQQFFG